MVANIWVAASDNQIGLVKNYIDSGEFTPNSKDINGYTPIHAATSYGHIELLTYLISKGGDINIQDADGDTPLHHVEDLRVAKFLIEQLKADYMVKNHSGKTAYRNIEEEDEFPEIAEYLRSLEYKNGEDTENNNNNNNNNSFLDSLPEPGETIGGHQIQYKYEDEPLPAPHSQNDNEISILSGLSEEGRENKLKKIVESENPEEALRELVTEAVHQHIQHIKENNDLNNEGPSSKKRKE
ncbi:hypothetical protein PACTADRAFT_45722 [Pachysolen tannophilus NRRL Y-2460]|uniref:Uncharacterized protein n=1 Tax=Pachysolen tannophilus NRRL Y-2460 TaxID=669874 RepID=A0A1E4TPF9_PACTA|nr:hypothetical protein PACTADRAFT_45722 [Pachysolen tannophilus NRRL Y-2460]